MEITDEREKFEAHFRPNAAGPSLDLTKVLDAWGRPKYKHEFVESIWYGWQARTALEKDALPAVPEGFVLVSAAPLRELLEALSGPGHLIREIQATSGIAALTGTPNAIETLIADFNRALAAPQPGNAQQETQ